jgi:hypothetical protein
VAAFGRLAVLTVTDEFKASVRESHRVSSAATIYPVDGPPVVAQVISGSIRLDRSARVRRTGSIVVGFDLSENLDFVRELPFGGYVKLERGILYPDGRFERPAIGYLRINTVSWSELEGQATLELADRMAQVNDEVFRAPWAPTTKPSQAITDAVYAVFKDAIAYHVSTDPTDETALEDAVYDSDRGQAIDDLASSIGADAYFDAAGDFVLRPEPPDPSTVAPVWAYDVGAGGNLEEVSENLDRSAVRNGVALKGQSKAKNPPFYTLVSDDDPSSPTHWGGPFGKVALLVNLSAMQNKKQAKVAGAALLNLRLGLARTVTLRGVPMPALEPDDVIEVRYLDGRTEQLRVVSMSMPLDVTASMEIVAAGHYRPATAFTSTRSSRYKTITGPAAWAELEDAEVVTT